MFQKRMILTPAAGATRVVSARCHPTLVAVMPLILFCLLTNEGYAQGCLNAAATGPVFQMSLLPLQQGEFLFEVNATPKSAGATEDGGIGLSRGRFGQFDDLAVAVRFSPQGTVDMRDGNVYRSDRVITYAANENYHIRLAVNTNTHRYSAYIRLLRLSTETTIGENYLFRTEQQSVTSLDTWGIFADVGALSACNGVPYTWPRPAVRALQFDGVKDFVEIPDRDALSIPTTGAMTVSAWIRPSTLSFSKVESSGYVHWLGKGADGEQEWVFRMYSEGNKENRQNRISFYVFNPEGKLGTGSYFQEPITPGEWIHVVGVADGERTYIYKNGQFKDCDKYRTSASGTCDAPTVEVIPRNGSAPVRVGTSDFASFFEGSIQEVRIWNRALNATEIAALFKGSVSRTGLVAEHLLTSDLSPNTSGGGNALVYAPWLP